METECIRIPRRIYREFIIEHRELTFIYGYDYQRKGFGGQSYSSHGEPNSYAVSTMRKLCRNTRYWTDGEFDFVKGILDEELAAIPRLNPIILYPKIGRGCSRMFEIAPRLYQYMISELDKIRYHNIQYYD